MYFRLGLVASLHLCIVISGQLFQWRITEKEYHLRHAFPFKECLSLSHFKQPARIHMNLTKSSSLTRRAMKHQPHVIQFGKLGGPTVSNYKQGFELFFIPAQPSLLAVIHMGLCDKFVGGFRALGKLPCRSTKVRCPLFESGTLTQVV